MLFDKEYISVKFSRSKLKQRNRELSVLLICVPLIIMDRVAGVMNLATSKTIELDQGNIDLLTAVGNQIAVAANNAMLHEDQKNKIEALKEKKEMIKSFAYTVSHDFKSPVTGIYGLTRRLREKYGHVLDEKGREYCIQIMKTAEHMLAVVEKLNAYIKTKEDLFNFERIKVKEVVETIRSQFATVFEQRRIRWSEPEIFPEIVADKLALSSVFRNFVDNALKYGGDDLCEIKIGYKENRSFHTFSFSDDGIGMKEGDEAKIFKVFQRNETSKGTDGSGLGLAIVKEIAKRHQGRVWVDTGTQKGTTFYISISKALEVEG
ncbi:MAG: HAMP domain-containing histidine kinase [Deltaproteobacteria bacterium]|nr:HAMP domain-containing histidine kinase [Deltaproteobacteria bacterium]